MELYLDTGNLSEIKEIAGWGILDGVTTNPTLLAREPGDYREILKEICEMVKGPVSAEVTVTEPDAMIKEAESLAQISSYIVVKIPCTPEGIIATRSLSDRGIRVNMTLIFSPLQALLAARAGASFASLFAGRLDDIGHEAFRVAEDILMIYKNYGLSTQLIFASIRHPQHVLQAARAGAHIATIPYKVFKQLPVHPLTSAGIERFLFDWRARGR
jgi:transaldolase